MPAKNPRLTITLKPSVSAYLSRISQLTGNSQSSLISEMLDEAVPVFARVVTVLEAAEKAKSDLGANMVAGLEEAQAKMEVQLGLARDLFEDAARPILHAAEAVKRRAAGAGGAMRKRGVPAPAASVPTPISNRGVRSNLSKPKAVS